MRQVSRFYLHTHNLKSIVEATISDLQHALADGSITSVDLVARYLARIGKYDCRGPCLNSIPIINPDVFEEARQSDRRRSRGEVLSALDGIPYTLKDSMKYRRQSCSAGSPAFVDLIANEDSFVAEQLRDAGAVCIGRTNTPPMMASGMHRGAYGRAESPYSSHFLTAAFSSGSSNGSGSSTAASFAAFGLGSETVSSGRSPASNNGLVAYTPSRTVISLRGVWPLYPTCDVIVPHTRTMEDMLTVLDRLTVTDRSTIGDFWRQQTYVQIPSVIRPSEYRDFKAGITDSLRGKRIAVPKMYIGGRDGHPYAKLPVVSPDVVELWTRAKDQLNSLGATVVETDFPLVTRYEDDSVSGQTNNVVGFAPDWNGKERGELVAYLWDDFLKDNRDAKFPGLASIDGSLIFPRPEGYIPDRYMEHKNFMNYLALVELASKRGAKSIWDIEGMAEALSALEAQRTRDLEDWMEQNNFDLVVFPANGDVGRADVDINDESAKHALQNGVKYSNGNRALRHMGVPTVSVTMGTLRTSQMPVNLTFAGKHGQDVDLLRFAYTYEHHSQHRIAPPLTPPLDSDKIQRREPRSDLKSYSNSMRELVELKVSHASKMPLENRIFLRGTLTPTVGALDLEAYVDGGLVDSTAITLDKDLWSLSASFTASTPPEPLYGGLGTGFGKVMVVVLVKEGPDRVAGKLIYIDQEDATTL